MMRLWSVYHENIPEFITDFAAADAMLRLKDIGMNCGLEYTGFPVYKDCEPYSRYDHSIGAALIIWHFTRDMAQTIAGLLHDISTPVFAHVVDFLNNDHIDQESTEEKTKDMIMASGRIMTLLRKYDLRAEDIYDYHIYPVADNDSPRLSADRLEYTLSNFINYRIKSLREVEEYYNDLTVVTNEYGSPEISFRSGYLAISFTEAALMNSKIYVADADRFSMQYLADILKYAMNHGILTDNDLYTTESEVIGKLKGYGETAALWNKLRGFSKIHLKREKPERSNWISVPAKKRYIDPFVYGCGRVSEISEKIRKEIEEFLSLSFDHWISAS